MVAEPGFDLLDADRFDVEALGRATIFLCGSKFAWLGRSWRGGVGKQAHGDVDVLEDLARGDAEDSIAGLDEVVASTAAMLAPEMVGEGET